MQPATTQPFPRGRRPRGWRWPVIDPSPPPPDEGQQERVDAAPHRHLQPGPGNDAAPAQPRGVGRRQRPRRVRRRRCLAVVVVVAAFVWGRCGKRPSPTIAGPRQQFADVAPCGGGGAGRQGGADPPPAPRQDLRGRTWTLPIDAALPALVVKRRVNGAVFGGGTAAVTARAVAACSGAAGRRHRRQHRGGKCGGSAVAAVAAAACRQRGGNGGQRIGSATSSNIRF